MSHELESMPRVEAGLHEVRIFPPSGDHPTSWHFDLMKGRVILTTFRFEAPINAAQVSLLRVRLNQRLMNSDERKDAEALGRKTRDELHFLRERGIPGIDESISAEYRMAQELDEYERKRKLPK